MCHLTDPRVDKIGWEGGACHQYKIEPYKLRKGWQKRLIKAMNQPANKERYEVIAWDGRGQWFIHETPTRKKARFAKGYIPCVFIDEHYCYWKMWETKRYQTAKIWDRKLRRFIT